MIAELDCVALTTALPERGLVAGDVGTVVHVFKGSRSYMVEFTTYEGATVALAKVAPGDVRPLTHNEVHHARSFDLAVH